MEGNMINVLNPAFVSEMISASGTRDVAAGIAEDYEVSVTRDAAGHSGAELNTDPINPQQRVPDIQDISVSSLSSRRIVLLGKSGVGKSAAGNTILRQKEFMSVMSPSSVTSESSVKHGTVSGRSVSVVDTPGFFDTKMNPAQLVTEIARSVYESSPGPHAFLFVFPVNMRFTEHEQQIPQMIEMMFGQEVLKYSIILFTHGDLLEEKSIEKLIEENCALRDLVGQCGGRFHVFNNRDENNRDQVNDLLKKIDTMIEQNGGGHYSNEMYEDAQRFRREEEEGRQREEEERQREEEERQREEERRQRQEEERQREEEERQREEEERQREEEERQREEEERQREEEERQRNEEQRQRQEEQRRMEIERVRRETVQIIIAEYENAQTINGFLLFLSKHKHRIYMAAVAAGFIISGAVAGDAVYGVIGGAVGGAVAGGAVGGAVAGGAERRTLTGAVGGAVVGGAVAGVVAGGAVGATVGAVAKAFGAVGGATGELNINAGVAVGVAVVGAVGRAVKH